jgi:dynein heavy chain
MMGPSRSDVENPLGEWLPNTAWFSVQKLIELEGFESFAQNMEKDAPNRFKEWFNELTPEEVKLPLDWKKLDSTPFQKLLVLRCLRPDRMGSALAEWIRISLPNGKAFMDCDGSSSFYEILTTSCEDSTSVTPVFFILSLGADPVKEVESMGRKQIQLQANVNYHNIAMGQGQDVVAMAKMDLGHKEGHWVMLQNIHLMPKWCIELEKKIGCLRDRGKPSKFQAFPLR